MYSVSMKKAPKSAPPSRAPTAFATVTGLSRKIQKGTSGDSCLRSKRKNAAMRTIAAAVNRNVCPESQPASGASDIA